MSVSETILLCQNKKQLNALGKMSAKERRHRRRRANLCGKRWFHQTSYRHWIVQGTTSRSETSAAETRVGQDEETGSARFTERENCAAAQAVANTFARGQKSTQTRIEPGCIAPRTIASGAFRRTNAHESQSFPRREKSGTHT